VNGNERLASELFDVYKDGTKPRLSVIRPHATKLFLSITNHISSRLADHAPGPAKSSAAAAILLMQTEVAQTWFATKSF